MKENLDVLCKRLREAHQRLIKAKETERTAYKEWHDTQGEAKRRFLYEGWSKVYGDYQAALSTLDEAKENLFKAITKEH